MNQEEKTLYVKLAYQYYQNKEYKRAYELYAKLAEADSEDFNVLNMLGDTYTKAGIADKAVDAYADSMSILERKGQNLKIIKLAKKVIKTHPEDARIKTKLKNALRNMMREAERKAMNHEYEEAREMYENMLDFSGDELPVNIKLQELNADEAKFKEREQQLNERKAEKSGSNTQMGLIEKFDRMAQNYISNGDFDGAVETYITALKLAPDNDELREKLHKVYYTISQKTAGERVWEKLDMSPKDKLEEAKKKAAEERRTQILKEEEERARRLMDEEARIQQEYEQMEADIISKAALELKVKLEEAQKKEKLKEEEIQRIMKEQEEKKRELLEKIKKEAIEKWKKQKEAIQAAVAEPVQTAEELPKPEILKPVETLKKALEAEPDERIQPVINTAAVPQPEKKTIKIEIPPMPFSSQPNSKAKTASLMDTLKKAYQTPVIGQGQELPESMKGAPVVFPKVEIKPGNPAAAAAAHNEDKKDEIMDDIGEVDRKISKDDVVVNEDTLDSLITTAYIYVNQKMFKEAMHIYNRIADKYPNNQEAKMLASEIAKKQG